jgi:nudix-type nucleoside diphosphatase (YffH/AdpP family)
MSRSRKANPTVTATKRVFNGFFKVDEVTVSYDRVSGPGRIEGQKRLVLERGDSVAAIIHDVDTDEVLLTEQVRVPTIAKGPGVVREVVAGSVELGEAPEFTMAREIEEEIGYRVPKSALKRIGMFYVSPGGTSERIVLFYARIKASQLVNAHATGVAHEGEDIALVKIKRETFIRQALTGKIDDAKTLVAGLWLATRAASGG